MHYLLEEAGSSYIHTTEADDSHTSLVSGRVECTTEVCPRWGRDALPALVCLQENTFLLVPDSASFTHRVRDTKDGAQTLLIWPQFLEIPSVF